MGQYNTPCPPAVSTLANLLAKYPYRTKNFKGKVSSLGPPWPYTRCPYAACPFTPCPYAACPLLPQPFICVISVFLLLNRGNIMYHHWVRGNLPLCSTCDICNNACGNEPRLSDYQCMWCHRTVHEKFCYCRQQHECDFGRMRELVIPPYSITLKTVGWRGQRKVVVKEVSHPGFAKWSPLLVFANPKSGGNEGTNLLKAFRGLLNPAQVRYLNYCQFISYLKQFILLSLHSVRNHLFIHPIFYLFKCFFIHSFLYSFIHSFILFEFIHSFLHPSGL